MGQQSEGQQNLPWHIAISNANAPVPRTSPGFTTPLLAWLTMPQLLQHSSSSFGWAPCDWHRARGSEENCPSAIKCPHLPPSPALACGTAAGGALAAPMPRPASPALTSESSLTHQIPLPGSNNLTSPAPASSCQLYHCSPCRQPSYEPLLCPWLGMEQVCGTARGAWSTCVAPVGRLGPHAWTAENTRWTDWQHAGHRQGAQVWH